MQTSGHFRVPIYQRLRKDQFQVAFDQLCRKVFGNFYVPFEKLGFGEEHVNVHLPFAKISSIYSFFASVFSFWQL